MTNFHSRDYVSYIQSYFKNANEPAHLEKFGIGISSDTPAFPDFYDFCSLVSGASLLASELIIQKRSDVVCNWMGGYHHAKKAKASGFCYVNDIVLSIQRLLENYDRVLYVDIDVHHGDGVEEAFFNTSRVLTLSIHQYDEVEKFFPGTGNFDSIGIDEGKFFAVNVPLKPGCDDDTFTYIFDKVFERTVAIFQPDVIWLQCGADSLVRDIIGRFRLSTKAHGGAVQKVLSYGIPTILGGGGGYTIENVARCWAYETSIALNYELPNQLPSDLYFYQYYQNDPFLHIYDGSMAKERDSENTAWKVSKDTPKNYAVYNEKVS